jgi:large subunit ribosomal protein L17
LHLSAPCVADIKQEDAVAILFKELAPAQKDRSGGYTRIIHAATQRKGDAARVALIEWVDGEVTASAAPVADVGAPATVAEVKAEEAKAEVKVTEAEKPQA